MSHGCKRGSGLIVCFPFFLVGEQRGSGCRTPAAHGTLWRLCDSPGRDRTTGVGQAAHLQLINRYRCRRDLRRLPQEMRQDGQLCSLLILILLLSARQFRRHKSRLGCRLNAGVAQWAERHGCRESRPPPWMADGGGPTERRRSEGTTTKESPNQEPGHLVTWCLFK
jgi:hypothetical protein